MRKLIPLVIGALVLLALMVADVPTLLAGLAAGLVMAVGWRIQEGRFPARR